MEEDKPVSWGTVIAGIMATGGIGFVLTVFSTLGGMAAYGESGSKALGVLITVAIPALLIGGFYAMTRRRSPDFGRGVLIGLCLVILWAGVCGGNMVGARLAG